MKHKATNLLDRLAAGTHSFIKNWFNRCKDKIVTFAGRARYKVAAPKETIVVTVGIVEGTSDKRRAVIFQGQQLAQLVRAEGIKRITETLYLVGYKQYLVHTRTLHRTKGLRTELALQAIEGSGALERLRLPLTVQEALRA